MFDKLMMDFERVKSKVRNSPYIEPRSISRIVMNPVNRDGHAGNSIPDVNAAGPKSSLEMVDSLLETPAAISNNIRPSLAEFESFHQLADSKSERSESPESKRFFDLYSSEKSDSPLRNFDISPEAKTQNLFKQQVLELRKLIEKMKIEEFDTQANKRIKSCIETVMSRFLDRKFGFEIKRMSSKLSPSDRTSLDTSPALFRQTFKSVSKSRQLPGPPLPQISIDQNSEPQSKTSSKL